MKGGYVATCPTFSWGRVASAILVDNFIGKEKKNLTFCFLGFGWQWQKRKGNPKEALRINTERKHKRMEKKENWKTQVKIRFVLFISILFCRLGVFGTVFSDLW